MRNEVHCIQHGNHKEGIEETPGQVHGYLRWVLCSMGFPGGLEVKASAWNAGDPGSIPGSGRSPGEGNGNPLQYSCLENPVEGGAWWATVHGVTKSRTWLSDLTFVFGVLSRLPGGAGCKEPACQCRIINSVSGSGRYPWARSCKPLQCSCLENSRDGETWWAAVSGVAQSRTRLKWLSSSSREAVQ